MPVSVELGRRTKVGEFHTTAYASMRRVEQKRTAKIEGREMMYIPCSENEMIVSR